MIEVVEGDRVRLIVENHLLEATAIHWHGLEIPIDIDGVPGVCQDPIPTGADTPMSLPCTKMELSSITPTWRCRK